MTREDFQTFEAFWPYYVREHQNKATRVVHLVATSAALVALAAGLARKRRRWLLGLAPVLAYGPGFLAHLFIEHNRPTSLRFPLWSVRANLRMCAKMIAGTMDAEVERICAAQGGSRSVRVGLDESAEEEHHDSHMGPRSVN